MQKTDLEKMGQAIADKFRGKPGPNGVRTGSPASATSQDPTHTTLVEAPPKPPEVSPSILNVPEPVSAPETVQVISLDLVLDSPFQPRCRDLTKKNLEDLANNIAANGQTTAIIVTRGTGEFEGKYHVHSGNRRCASIRLLGWKTVKAIVRADLGEREARRLALMDNLGREDLSAFEQAMGFKDFAEKYGLDGPTAARELGLSRRNAFRLQTISKASQGLLDVLRELEISLHAAERLARIDSKDPRKAARTAKRLVEGTISPEGLEREAMASSRGKRPSHTVKVAELQLSSKRVHLTIGFHREGLSSDQREEIRTAVATMLWHGGIAAVQPAQPPGEDERPEAVDEVEEAT